MKALKGFVRKLVVVCAVSHRRWQSRGQSVEWCETSNLLHKASLSGIIDVIMQTINEIIGRIRSCNYFFRPQLAKLIFENLLGVNVLYFQGSQLICL